MDGRGRHGLWHYANFFRHLFQGISPIVAGAAIVDQCPDMRALVEVAARALDPAVLHGTLTAAGHAEAEPADIRAVIAVFSRGNYPYLMTATLACLLLEGGAIAPDDSVEASPFEGRHAPDVSVPFVLMEAHHADPTTRTVYQDVKATLGLAFVNTDYRALARGPGCVAAAWAGLKPLIARPDHDALCMRFMTRRLRGSGAPFPTLPASVPTGCASCRGAVRNATRFAVDGRLRTAHGLLSKQAALN